MDALQSIGTDLNTLIPIINHWFHLLSAVIWIGGLAFLVMAVTPGLKQAVAKDQIKPLLMRSTSTIKKSPVSSCSSCYSPAV